MNRVLAFLAMVVALCPCARESSAAQEKAAALRLATFRCDVTPPLGGRFYGGWMQALTKLEAPLWAKGIVLEDGRGRYVVCALDWCDVSNSTHALFCRRDLAGQPFSFARALAGLQCL